MLADHFESGWINTSSGRFWLGFGQHGVTLFFVLSGYLITSSLLAEDRINIVRFYIRRAFRILPAAWVYLGFLLVVTYFTPFKLITDDLSATVFCWRNYFREDSINANTTCFWSLSVEEQFYIGWSLVLLIAAKKWAMYIAGFLTAAVALYRLELWGLYQHVYIDRRTEVRADALLVGCLLAYALQSEVVRRIFASKATVLFAVAAPLVVLDMFTFRSLIPLHECLLVAVLLGASVNRQELLACKVLDSSALRFFGLLSYSLYIWQGLFWKTNWGAFGGALTFVFAFLSWAFVERALIRVGSWLANRATSKYKTGKEIFAADCNCTSRICGHPCRWLEL